MAARGTIFLVAPVAWHFTWQRFHALASGLAAAGFEVVYIEPLPKRWPRARELRRVWARLASRADLAGGARQAVPEGVTICSPRLLPDTNPLTRLVNRRLVGRLAGRMLARFAGRPRVVLHYLPLSAAVALQRRLGPDLAVYDCVWDWPNDPFSRPGTLREEELVDGVDLVFADAPHLVERMRRFDEGARQLLPAVDYEHWAPARVDPPARDRPLCAYFGAVGANIDIELLRRLSWRFPLRLIGPVQVPLADLGPETEIVAPVPRERLPELLAGVDVLVLPYRRGGHVRGVIPAKTFECLATGRPVVASGLSSLEAFSELFTLCDGEQSFLAAVERAADDPPTRREARLAAARENDWRVRIGEVISAFEGALAAKEHDG